MKKVVTINRGNQYDPDGYRISGRLRNKLNHIPQLGLKKRGRQMSKTQKFMLNFASEGKALAGYQLAATAAELGQRGMTATIAITDIPDDISITSLTRLVNLTTFLPVVLTSAVSPRYTYAFGELGEGALIKR